jgi:hypothetical protein
MSFQFGDGFDCYAAPADAFNGYWDVGSASTSTTLVAGRFSGSRALSWPSFNAVNLFTKTSGQNDAVHHLSVAFLQTSAITGTTLGLYLQLLDGTTGQCAIVFKTNGDILLTAGTGGGAVLATYAGAVTVVNTWYQFEFEIVIHNSAGSFKVRKNGNPVDDHSTTGIDTQGSANAYANKLQVNQQATVITQALDDLYWRSDASSVAWMGDIRCYTRAPASDASVQFSRTGGASNFSCVDEPQQNTTTDYVFDSVPGHADFYTIAPIASTPLVTHAVVTRAYAIKSDAGTRTMAVQLKSGSTTVASPTVVLTTSNWQWAWRHDTLNPATSGAWTAAAVNLVQVGPVVIA